MTTIKYSRQRESIRNYLANTKDHPTADVIYQHLRELYPNISLGTVYRNLNLLIEEGEIMKVPCGDGIDHFDWNTSAHYHFSCRKCGCVLDLEMESINHINTIAKASFEGEIEGNVTYFYGICSRCKDYI